ncbi:MAG: hypothetical protein DCF16_16100 [Alphaproteobacteria bacterium]|nr:MAG: hypothetical protein DCF16_16100 [Alphaproteobacteria bacterium]
MQHVEVVDRSELVRRQAALAQFGEFVIESDDLQAILQESCRLVADALSVDLAKILELDESGETAFVRAGIGWEAGIVGAQRIALHERSAESFALKIGAPVITQNIDEETRFTFPEFMRAHGVTAIVNVPIFLPGRRPYGLIQADARKPRGFGDDDVAFLKTYSMILGPIIDRLKTVTKLRETNERLSLVVENARDYAILLSDADDHITDWLGGSEAILGWSANEITGKSTATIFTDDDRVKGIPARELRIAREAGSAPNVRWHQRKDGSLVYLDGQTIVLQNADASIRGYLKIAQDVTERRRAEERQAVLLAELQHRVRNVLAMVRSIARRTFDGGGSIDQVRAQLDGRIGALARTQALLTRSAGVGVDLELLIREELTAQASDGPVTLSGPEVELAPKAAEILTLAVHELSTNATKYGALGCDDGRLSVSWTLALVAGQQWLRLVWDESAGRAMNRAPHRSGFGTELLTRRVPYELRGRGVMQMRPAGLLCTIEFPLIAGESVLAVEGPA